MSNYIKSIDVKGLYGRFDLRQEFYPGVNILYGKNGTGKTTLLHILANALNGDYDRFNHLEFDSIKIELDDTEIIINERKLLSQNRPSFLQTAYFPAFRTMIEAWDSVVLEEIEHTININPHHLEREIEAILKTFIPSKQKQTISLDALNLARDIIDKIYYDVNPIQANYVDRKLSSDERMKFIRRLFGEFVPNLDYLSISEIQEFIVRDRELYGTDFEEELKPYLIVVNSFLENKTLFFDREIIFDTAILENTWPEEPDVPLKLKFNNQEYETLHTLSSGERQIVTMLYAASQMSDHQLILIDEPELSLHVDWQERLLRQMSEMFEGRQIIVCTHSPMIGAAFEERMMELTLTPTRQDRQDQEKMAA